MLYEVITLFGSANDRFLRGLQPAVAAINALEPELEALSDDALRARTETLRQRLADGETLDDVLVDAFATVREAAKRRITSYNVCYTKLLRCSWPITK